ncbi:hypothetical protein FACS1894162_1080 [Bacteroidia bacterium]|nr:hypothetical protein FACS1894162_1080 [Bacteroidia bacterium]
MKNLQTAFIVIVRPQEEYELKKIISLQPKNKKNKLEKHYPYPQKITALGVADEGDNVFKQYYPAVKTVVYDGRIFPFAENTFNIGWSNAVLEHVGDEEQQVVFLKEMHRTCKKLFFTTPNRYFLFELHTRFFLLHWLPKTVFDKILFLTSKSWATGDYMYLLSYKKLEKLLKKAGITNFKIYKNRFLGFTDELMDISKGVNIIDKMTLQDILKAKKN